MAFSRNRISIYGNTVLTGFPLSLKTIIRTGTAFHKENAFFSIFLNRGGLNFEG